LQKSTALKSCNARLLILFPQYAIKIQQGGYDLPCFFVLY
jgi:hypothetical protein